MGNENLVRFADAAVNSCLRRLRRFVEAAPSLNRSLTGNAGPRGNRT